MDAQWTRGGRARGGAEGPAAPCVLGQMPPTPGQALLREPAGEGPHGSGNTFLPPQGQALAGKVAKGPQGQLALIRGPRPLSHHHRQGGQQGEHAWAWGLWLVFLGTQACTTAGGAPSTPQRLWVGHLIVR